MKGPRRPFGRWILTLTLLASPLIHAGALLFHTRLLNFGSFKLWDALVYFLIAPVVGTLMLRRHERARFSAFEARLISTGGLRPAGPPYSLACALRQAQGAPSLSRGGDP